ncbi:hypothetical protein VOLCADRAFT_93644 [Volvox carteri f. nagariensis]|uniref:EF-hand domain-containing protein n=1 Tax=Volvox carteri f. nagariensis TaxID=3068 RepID=D8U2N1_VOLCA|nr:uncharacterized protein VOLCADRAFT_93644 [Volvox carteri f. nagariensis]EFJ45926.1 hypothetical protein VOLCADRAFT_93644 [Volvox carteri f. nagariensis]|eukprot:XP_002953004.1 hypothetical protein VOLCADRAFT_93644 [Volvox carteri f. nagariensis]
MSEAKALAAAKARPHPGAKVVVPTAAALAARSQARRLLVAGLQGVGVAAVSPAPRGTITPATLLLAMRLEARLYGRVRRVSNPAYSASHAGRYWSSVHSLHDLLRSDPRVRRGVLNGTVPLAAAVEIPAAELRALLSRLEKAARKGSLEGGPTEGLAMLAEKALAAADAADGDALHKQVSAGGRLDEPVPLFTEDWQPAEHGTDPLCAWHVADPWVWPYGTVLHNAVALGHVRTASWLLERGLSINCRISRWDLTPLHLCCMRPCLWKANYPFLSLFRIPARNRENNTKSNSSNTTTTTITTTARTGRSGFGRKPIGEEDAERAHYQYMVQTSGQLPEVVGRWDRKRGLPPGSFLTATDLIFPRVCKVKTMNFEWNVLLGPMWFSVEDEAHPCKQIFASLRNPIVRTLPCTAPVSTVAAAAAGGGVVMALVEAGASLKEPLPGSLVCPLHILAHRSCRRWSAISSRVVVQLLSYQPIIPVAEVMARWDEWWGCPFSWLLADADNCPAPEVLGPMLQSMRKALGAGPAPPHAGAAATATSPSGTGGGKELLVLGNSTAVDVGESGSGSGAKPGSEPVKEQEYEQFWLYPMINRGPTVHEEFGETEGAAMQRSLTAQLQIVQLLVGAGARVDAQDVYGSTPLVAAALTSSPPVVALLLEKGASVTVVADHVSTTAEPITAARLDNHVRFRSGEVLGPFLLMFEGQEGAWRTRDGREDTLQQQQQTEEEEGKKKKGRKKGGGSGEEEDEEDREEEEEEVEESDGGGSDSDTSSSGGRPWRPLYGAMGDDLLAVPEAEWKKLRQKNKLTPLTAAVMRHMRYYKCVRHQDQTGPGTGMQVDGNMSVYHFLLNNSLTPGARLSKLGDGILYLILHHTPAEVREALMAILHEATATNVVEEMPRTATLLLQKEMPGNHYVTYADRAAREACATLSPFTISSMDTAIQKALMLALKEAGLVGRDPGKRAEEKARAAQLLGSGTPAWGPYEDEVRLPAGVTYTAVDGLFLSILPGESGWNVTDLFRPRSFGFRLSFAYTRRTLTLELHALTLMRTIPIDIEEVGSGGGGGGGGGRSTVDEPQMLADSSGGAAVAGTAAAGATPAPEGCSADDTSSGGVRSRRTATYPSAHTRATEFGYWMRNPDVVRMEEVQKMAGRMQDVARKVGGNWRQMPSPPGWWTTGWVDRFLRLFLLTALTDSKEGKTKNLNLQTLYDTTVHGEDDDEDESDVRDLGGRPLSKQDIEEVKEVLNSPLCQKILEQVDRNTKADCSCISFTAQWNTLAHGRKWPLRSTFEMQVVLRGHRGLRGLRGGEDVVLRMVMLELLMWGDVSPDVRREVEAKLLSLASDANLARRLVWGTCRGRRADARTLALLSGVVEFQPLLVEVLLEHEASCQALERWSYEEQFWAVVGGPALEDMELDTLSVLLQEQHDFDYRPFVLPYKPPTLAAASAAAAVAAASTEDTAPATPSTTAHMAYCRFRSREDLERAVTTPLVMSGARNGYGGASRPGRGGAPSLLALLPVSLWEAGSVGWSSVPQRHDSVALPFFSLVFSRLPRGLQRADPHAAGTTWGSGVHAVVLHRRPGPIRWLPWGSPPDVTEEAGVELDTNDDGEVAYREFLLAYLRHRGGDFLGPRLLAPEPLTADPATSPSTQQRPGSSRGPPAAAAAAGLPDGGAVAAAGGVATGGGWQRANRAVAQGQLSQAFWDQAYALRKLRNRDGEAAAAARQGASVKAERAAAAAAGPPTGGGVKAGKGPGGGSAAGIAAVRQLGARALGALGGVLGFGATGSALPLVALAGLDNIAQEELSEVQRCAWIVYGNLRTAARYLQDAQADGYVAASGKALSGVVHTGSAKGGGGGGGLLDSSPGGGGRSHIRDTTLLELLVDLSSSNRCAAHGEVLCEGDEKLVGPMVGPSPLLRGRSLADVVTQLGADCAEEVATAVGALALDIASEGAARAGVAPPVGGLDEVFCAGALRLAAEEVWAFVMDMQALVDQVISPLVAAVDQSVPIIQRESIKTIFGDTNIEIILEYEIELLKLLTRSWRAGARTAMVVPSVAGAAHYMIGTAQRRLAASRLRAFGGEFPPSAEQELLACVDRDEKGTLTALLRRFSRPVKLKDGGPSKKGGKPSTAGPGAGGGGDDAAAAAEGGDVPVEDVDSDESFSEGEGSTAGKDGKGGAKQAVEGSSTMAASVTGGATGGGGTAAVVVAAGGPQLQQLQLQEEEEGAQGDKDGKGGRRDKGGRFKRLTHPAIHHVRPLLSVRQLARYGAGAEVEVCLRKPAAHLAALAFLANICRLWSLLLGVRVAKVLPLGADLHPLFKVPGPGLGGAPRSSPASIAEHRVAFRGVGAAVLEAEGAAGKLGIAPTLGQRLDMWMERRLLAGNMSSRVLLVVCTALTCLTWRVVPMLSERRRYLEDLRVANNLLHHRHVVRQLERAINVRPDDDDALDAELYDLHVAIQKAVDAASREVDFAGEPDKMSPMDLDSGFWVKQGPKRVHSPDALRAALKLAEERTLHSTFAGARLMSNARRCAARLASVHAGGASGKGGAKSGKGGKGGGRKDGGKAHSGGGGSGYYSDDSEDTERVLDALSAPAKGKQQQPQPPSQASKKKKKTAVKDGAAGGGGVTAAVQLVKLLGASKRSEEAGNGNGGGNGERKSAWGGVFGGGGMAAAVGVAQRVKQFGGALRRAVKRREHARRRWDKTLFLVMQSGAFDEKNLARDHAREVTRLRRTAALMAWKQLRGAADDMLMVFGEVVFRDVGVVFALAMAGFLMAFPFVMLGVAVQISPGDRHDRLLMGSLVGCYVLVGFTGMAAAVAQLRRDPSQLKVYRPSDVIRFPNFRRGTALSSWKAHWVNVFALFTLVLEFWQLCAFSYQRSIPYPKKSLLKAIFPWALLDLGPAAYFLQVFALLAFMVVWIAVFFPQTPAGLKRVIMPFLGQAAYLTITSGLLSQVNCRLSDGALIRNPDITCWTDPRHVYGAVAAMLALGLYVPRATLTPFEVFFPSENLDIKYRGLYVRVVQLLRLAMAGYNLFFADTYPLSVMVANAGVCALLAVLTIIMRPCCIGAVNIGRGTGFVLATWSQLVSVTTLRLTPERDRHMDYKTGQLYTRDWRYVYVLVAGWAVIAAAAASAIPAPPLSPPPPAPPPPAVMRTTRRREVAVQVAAAVEVEVEVEVAAVGAVAAGDGTKGTDANDRRDTDNEDGDEDRDGGRSAGGGGGGGGGDSGGAGMADAAAAGGGDGKQLEDSGTRPSSSSSSVNRVGKKGGAVTPAKVALAAALGLPVVDRSVLRKLAEEGLLSPADEMRAFMARLVRQAEQLLKDEEYDSDDVRAPKHISDEDSD